MLNTDPVDYLAFVNTACIAATTQGRLILEKLVLKHERLTLITVPQPKPLFVRKSNVRLAASEFPLTEAGVRSMVI